MNVICYLSNGFPTIEESRIKADRYYDAGCRIIEIDLPSHDPYLEGELIAGRMHAALSTCDDYEEYLANIASVKHAYPDMKVLLLAYENTVERVGVERLVEFCREHGILDMILVGDKHPEMKTRLMAEGIKVSCYIRYHLPEEEVAAARESNGFIYLQAKPIGSPVNPEFPELKDLVAELRRRGFTQPIYCGVGVYQPEDVKMVKDAGADAAFVGSSILKVDHDPAKLQDVISGLQAATK